MKLNKSTPGLIIILLFVVVFIIGFNITGNIITETDDFSHLSELHWTHMPLTYSIKNCENPENINRALTLITSQTNNSVYFEENNNPDIEFSCLDLENCYTNKTERRWLFWIVTTQAVCEHESGSAQMTKIKGKKILKAEIKLIDIGKEDNCSETIIHEILHVFNFQHSQNNESIMYPEKQSMQCNELIDEDVINELSKYKL